MVAAMSAPPRPYLGRTGMSIAGAVLFVVAAVTAVVAVVLPINQLTQPGGSVVVTPADLTTDRSLDLAGLPQGVVVVDSTPEALLTATDLPAGLRALTELPASPAAFAIAVGAFLLARVISTIHDGRPFDRRNPRRLAGLAAAVVLGGLVAPLSQGLVATLVLEHLGLADPGSPLALLSTTVPLAPIGIALVVVAGAEAFRRGAALAGDVDGLV
jgi:hypothetical protein